MVTRGCPCVGCSRRPNCKGCESFKEWRAQREKAKEATKSERDFKEYESMRYAKVQKYKQKHRFREGVEV